MPDMDDPKKESEDTPHVGIVYGSHFGKYLNGIELSINGVIVGARRFLPGEGFFHARHEFHT
jgi:hypothetical protein